MREIKFRAWDKETASWTTPGSLAVEPDFSLKGLGGDIVLMQFTGLKDKNGKEVYEGDIITDAHGVKLAIGFHDGGFWCVYPNGTKILPYQGTTEIVGNIYESPELLK